MPRVLVVMVCAACGRIGFTDTGDGQHGDASCVRDGFAPPVTYGAGAGIRDVAIGDLDRDGLLDVVAADPGGANIYFGSGAGALTFGGSLVSPTGANGLAIGDLDVDAYPDIVLSGNQAFCVLQNLRDRSFAPCVMYSTGNGANDAAIARMDDNESLDVVIANQIDDNYGAYLNKGDGSFVAAGRWGTAGTNVTGIAITALDGDAFGDIVAVNLLSDSIGIVHGSATAAPSLYDSRPTGSHPTRVAADDLDGDGDRDIVVGTYDSVDVFVNRDGELDPRIALPTSSVLTTDMTPRGVAIGNFGGVHGDVACANPTDNTVSIHTNRGDASFEPAIVYPAGAMPTAIAVGDLDANGLDDLVVAGRGDSSINTLLARCR